MSAPRTRADKRGSVHGRAARRRPALWRIHRPVGEPSRASRAWLCQPHAVRAQRGRSRSIDLPRCSCLWLRRHATAVHFRPAARVRRAAVHDRRSQQRWQAEEALRSDARSRRAVTGSPPAPHGAPGVAVRRTSTAGRGCGPSEGDNHSVDSAGRAACAAIATDSLTLNPGSATRATTSPISTTVVNTLALRTRPLRAGNACSRATATARATRFCIT